MLCYTVACKANYIFSESGACSLTVSGYLKNKNNIKTAFKFAAPCIGERLLLLVSGIVNIAIAGHLGSADILSAVSVSTTLLLVIQNGLMGLSLGVTVVSAHCCGHGDKSKVSSYVFHSLVMCLGVSVFMMLLLTAFRQQFVMLLFGSLGKSAVEYAVLFLGITMFTVPLNAVDITISSAMRGCGVMTLPLLLTFGASVLGAVAGYIFAFTLKMGIIGAAIGYFLNRAFGAATRLIAAIITNKPYKLKICALHKPRFDRLLKVGLPSCVEQSLLTIGFLATQSITSTLGAVVLSGFSAADNAMNLDYCINLGFESGAITQISEELGSGNRQRAKQVAFGNMVISLFAAFAFLAVLGIFAPFFVSLMASQPDVITTGARILRMELVCGAIVAVMQYITSILKSHEKVGYILFASTTGVWAVRVPIAYLLVITLPLGEVGFIAAMAADFLYRTVIYLLVIRKIKW